MVRQDSVNSVLDSFCLVAVVVVAAVAVVAVVAVVAAGFQTPWLSSVAVARKVMREPFVFGAETRSRQGRSSGAKPEATFPAGIPAVVRLLHCVSKEQLGRNCLHFFPDCTCLKPEAI